MASLEAISKVRIGRTTTYRKGTDTELIAVGSEAAMAAKLIVIGADGGSEGGRQVFRAGRLSVRMIRVASSPVCLVSCMVRDHQWTLAGDAVVLRVAPRMYVFPMPGFCYGLTLPCGGAYDDECRTLEEMLLRFCAFRCLESSSSRRRGESGDVWSHAFEEVKKLASVTVTGDASSSSTGPASPVSAGRREIQRAVRTSAVVKLLSRSLLTGALDTRKHLDLTVGASLPSMQMTADLLDMIETGRRGALAAPSGLWCINDEGMKLLLVILSACSTVEKRQTPQLETLNEEEEELKEEAAAVTAAHAEE
ncbi:uncharacterized protein LOC121995183 [Zingiber officinale]|uniref:uncharacterized protein LOC121995183 n=1 Tax=Zingiber officinale TaxID=94328 RepID=UPI001C4D676B|nr:uncharacterized protein LOC121995183 [Zingiber officinale]